MAFRLGINDWPVSSAMSWWRRFDAAEVARDFARIRAAGFDAVRLFLGWEDFQPVPEQVAPAMLTHLVTVAGSSLAQQLPSLVLSLSVSVHARRAHGHLQNLCQQSLARLALTCLKIRLRQSELESHVLGCYTEPLFEVGDRTRQVTAEHSRQLACDLPQGTVSAPVLIVRLQA